MPISSKVDVYSFGIMLVELICCRKNYEPEAEIEAQIVLVDWVYDCYDDGSILKLVESDEEASSDIKRVKRFVMTALWCIQEDPALRPTMKKITQMLEGVVEVLVPPVSSSFISSIFALFPSGADFRWIFILPSFLTIMNFGELGTTVISTSILHRPNQLVLFHVLAMDNVIYHD